jgi:glucokinase
MILVGDLGGTHTRLALVDGGRLTRIRHFENASHAGFAELLAGYLPDEGGIEAACIAVAGPTDGRRVRFTNLDWQIDADHLAQRFGWRQARLINDFAAVGWAINGLEPDDICLLQAGTRVDQATCVALGAGTGLGVSLCIWQDGRYRPLASEGGHIGYAPADARQDRLLAFMRQRYGRVSVERLLSGAGIADLYAFCRQETGLDPHHPLPPKAISAAALSGHEAVAAASLKLFAAILGQVAGDLALISQAQGGIYIAGGIAPQILPFLQGDEFLHGLHNKGRYQAWMRQLPVAVITAANLGLRGAALAAG